VAVPFIQQIGWPFSEVTDTLLGTRWDILLGAIPLYIWHRVAWSRIEVELAEIKFARYTLQAIDAVIDRCVRGLPTATTDLQDTEERFRAYTIWSSS